jgi:esterase/lipase
MSDTKTQMKFKINSGIASAFKARCAAEGVSMASVIQEWMITRYPAKGMNTKNLTRQQRKKTVTQLISTLNDVLEHEEQYRDSIPEQFGQRPETADQTCEKLAEAIDCLEEAY